MIRYEVVAAMMVMWLGIFGALGIRKRIIRAGYRGAEWVHGVLRA